MADFTDKQQPHRTERSEADRRARERRQAEALRANLRRRKERGAAGADDKKEPERG